VIEAQTRAAIGQNDIAVDDDLPFNQRFQVDDRAQRTSINAGSSTVRPPCIALNGFTLVRCR